MAHKKSIRFFNDRQVRAVWDEDRSKWWFSAIDIVRAINDEEDYKKAGNYWRWLKKRLSGEGVQLVSVTHDFKFEALDGQSKKKAYDLFECGLLNALEPGTVRCLQQIHSYIFGGLYDFAGQIRSKNISKGGFSFANAIHLHQSLKAIEQMPEKTFDEIADKYVEMNVAHPFMEGNGRTTRIWLDLMLKRSLRKCVDWSRIDKSVYLDAMRLSVVDPAPIKALLMGALTEKIDDRETFMKGIDYSYYYEES